MNDSQTGYLYSLAVVSAVSPVEQMTNDVLDSDWLQSCDVIHLHVNLVRATMKLPSVQPLECRSVCVCSGTHRCWRSLRAGAGRILVSSCGTGTRRCSADSPVHLCCGRIHTAASRHVRHIETHEGYTYTCRKDTEKNPSCCSCVTVFTLSESTIKLFIESCQLCCSVWLFLLIFGRFYQLVIFCSAGLIVYLSESCVQRVYPLCRTIRKCG